MTSDQFAKIERLIMELQNYGAHTKHRQHYQRTLEDLLYDWQDEPGFFGEDLK